MDGIPVVSLPSLVTGSFIFVYTMKILNKMFLWGVPQHLISPTRDQTYTFCTGSVKSCHRTTKEVPEHLCAFSTLTFPDSEEQPREGTAHISLRKLYILYWQDTFLRTILCFSIVEDILHFFLHLPVLRNLKTFWFLMLCMEMFILEKLSFAAYEKCLFLLCFIFSLCAWHSVDSFNLKSHITEF